MSVDSSPLAGWQCTACTALRNIRPLLMGSRLLFASNLNTGGSSFPVATKPSSTNAFAGDMSVEKGLGASKVMFGLIGVSGLYAITT